MYVRSCLYGLRLVGLLLALAGVQVAHAAGDKIYSTELGNLWQIPNGNSTKIVNTPTSVVGANATTIQVAPATAPTGGTVYGSGTVLINGAGGVQSTKTVNIPIGDSGKTVPVSATTEFSKAAIAAAVARVLGGPAGTVAALAIPSIVDWFNKNGIQADSTGQSLVAYPDLYCKTGSTCYWWVRANTNINPTNFYKSSTGLSACQAIYEDAKSSSSILAGSSVSNVYLDGANCRISGVSGLSTFAQYMGTSSTYPTPSPVPVTPTGVGDKLSKSTATPPSPQVVPDLLALRDPTVPPVYIEDVPSPTLAGPQQAVGPTSTTTVPAQNGQPAQQIINNTVYNFNYSGNEVTATETTTETTQTQQPDGSWLTTDQRSTTSPTIPSDAKTDCDKYPNSMGCQSVSEQVPGYDPLRKNGYTVSITSTAGFTSSASCPAPVTFTALGKPYAFSYQPLCDKLAVVKVIVLLLAGVAAAWIVADSFKV